MYAAQGNLVADVVDSDAAQVWLCDGFVHSLILLNAPQEVPFRVLARHVLIIGIAGRDLERDVRSNNCRVVTKRLQEDDMNAVLACHPLLDLRAPASGTIRCV